MAKKRFEYLSHTADVSFVAYGNDFKSALESSALALFSLMLDVKRIKALKSKKKEIRIEESASNRENLAWYLLQDLLSRIDAQKLNAYDFKVQELKEGHDKIKATGKLSFKDNSGDFALLSVKAITPYGLTVTEEKGKCSITVVADV